MDGYSISGWKCISDIQVTFVIKLEIDWEEFLLLIKEFKEEIQKIIGGNYPLKFITLESLVEGSVEIQGNLQA